MKMTVKEFAIMNNISPLMANAVLKVLAILGSIVELESIKAGKGRPTKVYDVPEEISMNFKGSGRSNIKTFAEKNGIENVNASSFLKFLSSGKCIVELDSDSTGKGRPTKYFDIPDSLTISRDLSQDVEEEENSEEEEVVEMA